MTKQIKKQIADGEIIIIRKDDLAEVFKKSVSGLMVYDDDKYPGVINMEVRGLNDTDKDELTVEFFDLLNKSQ